MAQRYECGGVWHQRRCSSIKDRNSCVRKVSPNVLFSFLPSHCECALLDHDFLETPCNSAQERGEESVCQAYRTERVYEVWRGGALRFPCLHFPSGLLHSLTLWSHFLLLPPMFLVSATNLIKIIEPPCPDCCFWQTVTDTRLVFPWKQNKKTKPTKQTEATEYCCQDCCEGGSGNKVQWVSCLCLLPQESFQAVAPRRDSASSLNLGDENGCLERTKKLEFNLQDAIL